MANKNDAKRVPVAAVMTVGAIGDGRHTIGFIEGNIAISRVMLVVTEGFDGTTPTVVVEETVDGNTGTHFTGEDISTLIVATSLQTTPDPVTGTVAPLFNEGKGEWFVNIVGGSTVGEALIIVEYTQLDTEPGLHSLEDN